MSPRRTLALLALLAASTSGALFVTGRPTLGVLGLISTVLILHLREDV
jgi:hypothetical protein